MRTISLVMLTKTFYFFVELFGNLGETVRKRDGTFFITAGENACESANDLKRAGRSKKSPRKMENKVNSI
jgi:hypothetical protein